MKKKKKKREVDFLLFGKRYMKSHLVGKSHEAKERIT